MKLAAPAAAIMSNAPHGWACDQRDDMSESEREEERHEEEEGSEKVKCYEEWLADAGTGKNILWWRRRIRVESSSSQ